MEQVGPTDRVRLKTLKVFSHFRHYSCHFPKSASAIAIGNARLALSHSTAIRVRVVCSNRHFAKDGCNTVQVIDVSLVAEAAWREAQRRAEVIRSLVECDLRPPHLLEVPLLKPALKFH